MKQYFQFRKWPLWMQLALVASITFVGVAYATGEYLRSSVHQYLSNNVEKHQKRVINTIASTVIESIIIEDIPIINTIIKQVIATNHDVSSVFIRNEDGKVLAMWKNKYSVEKKYTSAYLEVIRYKGEIFGQIEIEWNLKKEFLEIDKYIRSAYLMNIAALFFLTVIFIVGIHWLVTRPLNHIQHRIIDFSKGVSSSKNRLNSSSEFFQLYDAVDKLEELTISKKDLQKEITQRKEAQKELAKARDQAIIATNTKSEFLANMSHEIRTPLTAILGFSEMLMEEGQSPSDHLESIQTIIKSGKHLHSLINNILDLTKIEAGKLTLEEVEVDLFETINDAYSLLKLQALGKGLQCSIKYNYPLPDKLITDELRVKQVLINLCGNAIKFTDKGCIAIDVSFDKNTNKIIIVVEDTGIGMTSGQLDKIFDAFSQADSSTTRKYGGTGLGLHLSHVLAHNLGGTIVVKSEERCGSRFTFQFDAGYPVKQKLIEQAPAVVSIQPGRDLASTVSGRVLLVEDNEDNQRLISLYIRRLGVDVTTADNGQEAVEVAMANHFDLVLMDMQMPVMGGVEAIRILRGKGYKGIIVALTANAMLKEKEVCFAAGCQEFLTKPVNQNKLRFTILHYLMANEATCLGNKKY